MFHQQQSNMQGMGYAEQNPNWGYGHYGNWNKSVDRTGGRGKTGGNQMAQMGMGGGGGMGFGFAPQQIKYGGASRGEDKRRPSDDNRKVFVGGLPRDAKKDALETLFGEFGEIDDCYVITDPKSGRARGFGFVKFTRKDTIEKVMEGRPFKVEDKEVIVKRVLDVERPENLVTSKKLFVGGLKEQSKTDLSEYFAKFGDVQEVEIAADRDGKPRKFAMITFDDYDSVDRAIMERRHTINGTAVGVRKFLTKDEMAKCEQMKATEQGFGGRGDSGASSFNFAAMSAQIQGMQHGAMRGGGVGGGDMGSMMAASPADFGYGAYGEVIPESMQGRGGGGGGKKKALMGQQPQQPSAKYAIGNYQQQMMGYGMGQGGMGSGSPRALMGGGGGAVANNSVEAKFLYLLQQANVSESGCEALARENLLSPQILSNLTLAEFNSLPLNLGDRKRVQLALSSLQ